MLDIVSISKKFGAGASAFHALRSIDIKIEEGEFFTLLGPSGCGKTTLLRLIAGFEQPTGGQLILDGTDIATTPPNRRPVNTVFQNYALFPHMTVAENVAFGLEALGTKPSEIGPRVDEIIEVVQLTHLRDRKSSQMSGGQQQRVALARALAPRPRILLLDEPLPALDLKLRKQMQFELKRIQRELGLTFIFVTHDQDEALTMSDRIAVMEGGNLQQVASPRSLYDQPANRFVAEFIGEANFLPGTVADGTLALAGCAPVPLPGNATARGPVTVMIRPEQVVAGATADDSITLEGKIESLVFSGTYTQVSLRLQNGASLSFPAPNTAHANTGLTEGQTVQVSLPLAALRLLPREDADAA